VELEGNTPKAKICHLPFTEFLRKLIINWAEYLQQLL